MIGLSIFIVFIGTCVGMPAGNATTEGGVVKPEVVNGTAVENGTLLVSNATTEETTTEPTTTEDDFFCAGYAPGNSSNEYVQFSGGISYNMMCNGNLVWSQERCSCVDPPMVNVDPKCPYHRSYGLDKRKYEILDHGRWRVRDCPRGQIWFQSRCWCDTDPNAPQAPPEPDTTATTPVVTTPRTTTTTSTRAPINRLGFVSQGTTEAGETVAPTRNTRTTSRPYCIDYSPGPEPNTFLQRGPGGIVYNFTCEAPLVWSQEECVCVGQEVPAEDPDCPDYRPDLNDPTKYRRLDHGVWLRGSFSCPSGQVWNQTNCWCDYPHDGNITVPSEPAVEQALTGPCYPIFNATFDYSIDDDSSFGYRIGREPWHSVSIEKNVPGAIGGAARVTNGRMPLWFTGDNDLGGKLQIEIRFKLMENNIRPNREIRILSNQRCSGGPQSISIMYRPSDLRYRVFFRVQDQQRTLSCTANSKDPYAFHHLDLVFFNDLLTLTVDGEECFGAVFETGLLRTACYMNLGERNFNGYFDEVVFRRGCLEEEETV